VCFEKHDCFFQEGHTKGFVRQRGEDTSETLAPTGDSHGLQIRDIGNITFRQGNKYRGITKQGIEIEFYIDSKTREITTAFIYFNKN